MQNPRPPRGWWISWKPSARFVSFRPHAAFCPDRTITAVRRKPRRFSDAAAAMNECTGLRRKSPECQPVASSIRGNKEQGQREPASSERSPAPYRIVHQARQKKDMGQLLTNIRNPSAPSWGVISGYRGSICCALTSAIEARRRSWTRFCRWLPEVHANLWKKRP